MTPIDVILKRAYELQLSGDGYLPSSAESERLCEEAERTGLMVREWSKIDGHSVHAFALTRAGSERVAALL